MNMKLVAEVTASQIRNDLPTIAIGDTVVTIGGIYGIVKEVQETTFLLEVAKDVTIKVDKGSVYVAAEDAQQQQQTQK